MIEIKELKLGKNLEFAQKILLINNFKPHSIITDEKGITAYF